MTPDIGYGYKYLMVTRAIVSFYGTCCVFSYNTWFSKDTIRLVFTIAVCGVRRLHTRQRTICCLGHQKVFGSAMQALQKIERWCSLFILYRQTFFRWTMLCFRWRDNGLLTQFDCACLGQSLFDFKAGKEHFIAWNDVRKAILWLFGKKVVRRAALI